MSQRVSASVLATLLFSLVAFAQPLTMSFTGSPLSITVGGTGNLTLNLSGPAPAGVSLGIHRAKEY